MKHSAQKDPDTSPKTRPKGPWLNRMVIWALTLALGILTYLLEGFFIRDIESIKGPDWQSIETNRVDVALRDRSKELTTEIGNLDRRIARLHEEQRILSDGSRNLQDTITQLVELQKLSLQKELALSDSDQQNLANTLNQFLETQTAFQTFNQNLHDQAEQKRLAEDEKQELDAQINELLIPAREEYNELVRKHRMWLATLELCLLVPLLIASGFLVIRRNHSVYFPVFLAYGMATLFKAYWVVNKYFPAQYVKYILILTLLAGVGKVLVHAIGIVAFPGKKWLQKQYREAYERFLCPICEYPIRTGPRRFLYWTRRTVHKTIPHSGDPEAEQTYTCPSCGTRLFEECTSCHHVRHSLLTHCCSCGDEKKSEPVN